MDSELLSMILVGSTLIGMLGAALTYLVADFKCSMSAKTRIENAKYGLRDVGGLYEPQDCDFSKLGLELSYTVVTILLPSVSVYFGLLMFVWIKPTVQYLVTILRHSPDTLRNILLQIQVAFHGLGSFTSNGFIQFRDKLINLKRRVEKALSKRQVPAGNAHTSEMIVEAIEEFLVGIEPHKKNLDVRLYAMLRELDKTRSHKQYDLLSRGLAAMTRSRLGLSELLARLQLIRDDLRERTGSH